jgi:hypothetical protein
MTHKRAIFAALIGALLVSCDSVATDPLEPEAILRSDVAMTEAPPASSTETAILRSTFANSEDPPGPPPPPEGCPLPDEEEYEDDCDMIYSAILGLAESPDAECRATGGRLMNRWSNDQLRFDEFAEKSNAPGYDYNPDDPEYDPFGYIVLAPSAFEDDWILAFTLAHEDEHIVTEYGHDYENEPMPDGIDRYGVDCANTLGYGQRPYPTGG